VVAGAVGVRCAAKVVLVAAAGWLVAPVVAAVYVCGVAVVFELIDRWARRLPWVA
jgi:hypothetical protein